MEHEQDVHPWLGQLVRRVAERLYVLSLGKVIAHGGPTAEILADETARRVYVG